MWMINKNMTGVLVLLITTIARADAGLPDPTRPADYAIARVIKQAAPGEKTQFAVNAIRISASDRSAIINGKMVHVGDEIANATVKEIRAVEVVLDFERKLLTVPLYARNISKHFKISEVEN